MRFTPIQTNIDPAPAQALIERHKQITYPYMTTFGPAVLEIDKDVFCPTLTNVSPLLLSAIDFRPHEQILDVFAGSGAFGIIAALNGSHAVTIDNASPAVLCTRKNAAQNGVGDLVNSRLGTVETCLNPNESFDLIIANPPLLPGQPSDYLQNALFDDGYEATKGFLAMLPKHLKKHGRAYIISTSVSLSRGLNIEELCSVNKLLATPWTQRDYGYEVYRVHKITWGIE